MTAAELIEVLQKLPPDLRVLGVYDNGCGGPTAIERMFILDNELWITASSVNDAEYESEKRGGTMLSVYLEGLK